MRYRYRQSFGEIVKCWSIVKGGNLRGGVGWFHLYPIGVGGLVAFPWFAGTGAGWSVERGRGRTAGHCRLGPGRRAGEISGGRSGIARAAGWVRGSGSQAGPLDARPEWTVRTKDVSVGLQCTQKSVTERWDWSLFTYHFPLYTPALFSILYIFLFFFVSNSQKELFEDEFNFLQKNVSKIK